MNKSLIVLFGNGEIPTHPSALTIIDNAKTIICLDGGADKLIELGYKPDAILGDLDSLLYKSRTYDCDIIKLLDQNKTDLEKGLEWCFSKSIRDIYLIGFSGERDDHNTMALYSLFLFSEKIKMIMITNHSTIHCLKGKSKFSVIKEQSISLIVKNANTSISTKGLKYELNNEKLISAGHGVSNIAIAENIEIITNDWTWIFINHIK